MTRLLSTMLLIGSLGAAVAVADVTGDWELELNPDFGGIDDVKGCTLKQDGEKLTVNCGAGPNILGEVHGRRVTFVMKTGRKDEYAATFTGELDERETTIAGTWTLTLDDGKREGKFTLRKH